MTTSSQEQQQQEQEQQQEQQQQQEETTKVGPQGDGEDVQPKVEEEGEIKKEEEAMLPDSTDELNAKAEAEAEEEEDKKPSEDKAEAEEAAEGPTKAASDDKEVERQPGESKRCVLFSHISAAPDRIFAPIDRRILMYHVSGMSYFFLIGAGCAFFPDLRIFLVGSQQLIGILWYVFQGAFHDF